MYGEFDQAVWVGREEVEARVEVENLYDQLCFVRKYQRTGGSESQ